jgi:hypothetical protein
MFIILSYNHAHSLDCGTHLIEDDLIDLSVFSLLSPVAASRNGRDATSLYIFASSSSENPLAKK